MEVNNSLRHPYGQTWDDVCGHHLAAIISLVAPGQPSSPKPFKIVDRAHGALRRNLAESQCGLIWLKRVAGLPPCASDPPWKDSLRLICPCKVDTPCAGTDIFGGPSPARLGCRGLQIATCICNVTCTCSVTQCHGESLPACIATPSHCESYLHTRTYQGFLCLFFG